MYRNGLHTECFFQLLCFAWTCLFFFCLFRVFDRIISLPRELTRVRRTSGSGSSACLVFACPPVWPAAARPVIVEVQVGAVHSIVLYRVLSLLFRDVAPLGDAVLFGAVHLQSAQI
jgi:hypothetical protein